MAISLLYLSAKEFTCDEAGYRSPAVVHRVVLAVTRASIGELRVNLSVWKLWLNHLLPSICRRSLLV
ncbi:MAG: hypothetical protein GY903_31170 [Fuerstiella sp.]|nr:hypothetical protein [Fuerstiella sp.]MCP4858954.1 hypothetical protein [Fuerstiella sp.]